MKKTAILCNNSSSSKFARTELVDLLNKNGVQVYVGGVYDGQINDFFNSGKSTFVPIIASRSNTNPLVEIKSIFNVRKAIKKNGIDSVIIYGVKNHAAMAIGARLGGAKSILCVVNGSGNLFRVGGIKGKILRFLSFPMLRIAYKHSSSICFQNEDDRQLFIEKKLIKPDEKKCFVTGGSGVNLNEYSASELPEKNRFLFLSRITPSKGIKEYIKAAEVVKSKYSDSVFDIVGPIDSAVEVGINDVVSVAVDQKTVNYYGPTNDVPSWIEKCRFFVYPSYYPEGVPRCAMQAIACGRPIITCLTPGCKETVIDGVNGFAVEPQNYEAIAEKMIWMIEHKREVEKMALASRRLAEEKFDVQKINEELVERLKA